ncbi:hypothetical protein AeNC1_007813 [Aphanomyces euteiches]|nr:hypothetical protein AeNC1_007813 [Aphanomyces euteiches]
MTTGTSEDGVVIWFVRHGQTDWNTQHRLQGHTDVPLNATGVAQAHAAAKRLQQVQPSFHHVVSSDLSRALITAQAIDASLDVGISLEPGLREHSLGHLQGLTFAEMTPRQRRDYERLRTNPAFDGHGGESSLEMATRVRTTLATLAEQYAGKRIVAVTHGGFLYHANRNIREMSIDRSTDATTPNACICVVEWRCGKWHILEWGLTDHLASC